MKTTPKSTKQKITMQEINNALYPLISTIGSSIEFTYKGGRQVKGILIELNQNRILLKLLQDYNGANEHWERGQIKSFYKRIIYNHNFG